MDYLENPDRVDRLDRVARAALFAQVKTLEGRLLAGFLTGGGGEPEHQTPASAPSTPPAAPCMLTRFQVAKRIAVSKITVSRMVKRKTFPAPVRVGSQLRWRSADVEQWERRA